MFIKGYVATFFSFMFLTQRWLEGSLEVRILLEVSMLGDGWVVGS